MTSSLSDYVIVVLFTYLGYEGHWTWSHSGQNLTESFWGPNSPNHMDGNTDDCGVMTLDALQFWWEDSDCLATIVQQKKVAPICQRDRVCPEDWEQYEDHCYMFHTNSSTWADAENDCVSKGGHLASVHSKAENDFIDSMYSAGGLWLGAKGFVSEVQECICIFILFHR